MTLPGQTRGKVLVIDDEFFFRATLRDALADGGFEVFTSPDGEEGLEVYKRELPEVVISDLIMPKKGGVSCCIEIANHARSVGQDPIVVLFSSMFNKEPVHEHDPPEMGARIHMPKTIKPVDVLILVEQLIERKKAGGGTL